MGGGICCFHSPLSASVSFLCRSISLSVSLDCPQSQYGLWFLAPLKYDFKKSIVRSSVRKPSVADDRYGQNNTDFTIFVQQDDCSNPTAVRYLPRKSMTGLCMPDVSRKISRPQYCFFLTAKKLEWVAKDDRYKRGSCMSLCDK